MDEFIQLVNKQLGVSLRDGRTLTGRVLRLIQSRIDPCLFDEISAKLPGLRKLIDESEERNEDGRLLGSLTSLAGSLLGDNAKGFAQVTEALRKAGLSMDQIPQYLSLLIDFLKSKLGNDLFAALASKLPELLGQKK